MIEERLLGFDVREQDGGPEDLWDSERRSVFLLRVDAVKPLSADTLVWPSLFDTCQGIGFSKAERERLHLPGIPLPASAGLNTDLWVDASYMQRYLIEHWPQPRSYVVIAVSWISDSGFSDAGTFGPYLTHTLPKACDPDWERLGFDVCDGSLVSGLTNCGYLPGEAQLLRPQWGPLLNQNHLFDDLEHALQFRHLTDRRVLSHAPFFVYGLYLIEAPS